jgi:membrane glycosyltransferase
MTNGNSSSGMKMAIYIVSLVISFSLSVELTFAEAKLFLKPEEVDASKLVAQGRKSRRVPESKIIELR